MKVCKEKHRQKYQSATNEKDVDEATINDLTIPQNIVYLTYHFRLSASIQIAEVVVFFFECASII